MPRQSLEKQLIDRLVPELGGLELEIYYGQTGQNRFDVQQWSLPVNQQFQFGDLRLEARARTIVVEFESAGGVTNLVKYWPLLRSKTLLKPLVLVHVYSLSSVNDYRAHRLLWVELVERMSVDLAGVGLTKGHDWEAYLRTVRTDVDLRALVGFLRLVCTGPTLS